MVRQTLHYLSLCRQTTVVRVSRVVTRCVRIRRDVAASINNVASKVRPIGVDEIRVKASFRSSKPDSANIKDSAENPLFTEIRD
jgi:hypothetical protein